MSESLIPFTPENETTEERFFWDNIIRVLEQLHELSDEVDILADLEDLKDEDREDALLYVYNYLVELTVPPESSDTLEKVEMFLIENGLFEEPDFLG